MAASDHFFQLRSLPGTAWPAVPYPQMSLIWNAYQAIERTQWLGAAEIETMQLRQVNALLAHARRNVPYYAKLFADAGIADRPIESLEEFRKSRCLRATCIRQISARSKRKSSPTE